MKQENWIWMPHPGHFICSFWCRFHLNTYVGNYIVSTVGEYLPDEGCREILAKSRGITLEGRGDARLYDYLKKIDYEKLGFERKYETMVFIAKENKKDPCCPWRMETGRERDFAGYNTPEDAQKGHMAMCKKWAGEEIVRQEGDEEPKDLGELIREIKNDLEAFAPQPGGENVH